MKPYTFSWNGDLFAPTVWAYEFEQPDPWIRVRFNRGFVDSIRGPYEDVRRYLPGLVRSHLIVEAVPDSRNADDDTIELPDGYVESLIRRLDGEPGDMQLSSDNLLSKALIAEAIAKLTKADTP